MNKIKIIAEVGWNHMGNMNVAEKMIKAASKSGADYAKFQTWRVKNLKAGPWDKDGRREIYKKAELKVEDYKILNKICKKYKIKFLTSLFNENDFDLIQKLNLKEIKIPSPENRNNSLIEFCSRKFNNIFLSTGAATIKEIYNSCKLLKNNKVVLMHCVSSYPCENQNVNLSRIFELKKISSLVGLSDHTKDIISSILSLSMGVTLIEKHFTIDNSLPGRDNKFAILPNDMMKLSETVRIFEQMFEQKKKGFIKSEIEVRKIYTGRWKEK